MLHFHTHFTHVTKRKTTTFYNNIIIAIVSGGEGWGAGTILQGRGLFCLMGADAYFLKGGGRGREVDQIYKYLYELEKSQRAVGIQKWILVYVYM